MEAEHVRTLASVMAVESDREAVKAEIEGKGAVFALYYSYPLYYNDFVNEQGDSSYYMPYTIKGKKATVKRVETKKKKIRIPAYIKYKGRKYPVTKIGRNAFRDNRFVRHIIIGRNIRSIGKESFEGCRRLKKITILGQGSIS